MYQKIAGSAAFIVMVLLIAVGMMLATETGWTFASELEIIGDDLGITVTPANTPLFTEQNMAPGDTSSATVTVSNKGRHDFSFTLSAEKESGDDSIYNVLWIDVTGRDLTEYYSGPLKDLADIDITRLARDEDEELTLTVTFDQSSGNLLQGASTSVKFIFAAEQHRTYNIVAQPEPPEGGTVTGSGVYDHGDPVTLAAEANDGYAFVYYLEGSALYSILENEYTFTALEDRSLIAEFWEATEKTRFARVDLDENGYGLVDFDGVKLEFFDGPPNISGVVSFTPCDTGKDSVPRGMAPTGLYFCFRRSPNLDGTRVRLELSYADALPLPQGAQETSLKLYRWNKTLQRWDQLFIVDQGVNTLEKIIWADVDNFSAFGIFYKPPKPGALPRTEAYLYWLIPLGLAILVLGCYLLRRRAKTQP